MDLVKLLLLLLPSKLFERETQNFKDDIVHTCLIQVKSTEVFASKIQRLSTLRCHIVSTILCQK